MRRIGIHVKCYSEESEGNEQVTGVNDSMIRMLFKEMVCKYARSLGWVQWWAMMNTAKKLRVP
jgi:hypothetical protein